MKREVKFRGKRIDTGQWIYGDLVQWKRLGLCAILPQEGDELHSPRDFQVVPETVGQFTGLQDKNGVDIYEGDILKIHHEYYDIRFAETAFCLFGRFGMWGSVARMIAVCKDIEAEIHVVGNIHDNPELLTK